MRSVHVSSMEVSDVRNDSKNAVEVNPQEGRCQMANAAMTVKIEKGQMIITIPVEKTPSPSASGKTKLVATSGGNIKTDIVVEGKPLFVGVNAYIKN